LRAIYFRTVALKKTIIVGIGEAFVACHCRGGMKYVKNVEIITLNGEVTYVVQISFKKSEYIVASGNCQKHICQMWVYKYTFDYKHTGFLSHILE